MSDIEYVELHCHSFFSFLDAVHGPSGHGASSPEALVAQAATLGYPALVLTDHNNLSGVVRFWQAAHEWGIHPIVGAELTLAGTVRSPSPWSLARVEGRHLVLLAETQQGYANLCRLISGGQLAGQKHNPRLLAEVLAENTQGLLCLSGCRQGVVASALLAGNDEGARQAANYLREIFGPRNFWIEIQQHSLPQDARLMASLLSLAQELGIDVVATNNVHYAERSGQQLHDLLTCVRQHTTLPQALAGGLLRPNSEQFLKSAQEMEALFRDLPQALRNTRRIAERCEVSLDFSKQRLPAFSVPEGHTPQSYLHHLCEIGLRRKFLQPNLPWPDGQSVSGPDPGGLPTNQQINPLGPYRHQLTHELTIIEQTELAGYFLVVWDIVRFARSQNIRCQGRGSAANSLVAYLLDITPVDPLRHNLLFERFLSEGTHTMPDIDIDFAADRREEVIQYVYHRYGEEHVGMVCNVVTYRARSAFRDAAKALAFPPDVVDRVAKALDTRSCLQAAEGLLDSDFSSDSAVSPPKNITRGDPPSEPARLEGRSLPWKTLAALLRQMEGIPHHLSIHVGGMLITAAPLVEVVPLERATMPGRVVVQWDKDSVEAAGLIKIDLLSLRTLGAIEEALAHIHEGWGCTPDLDQLRLDNPQLGSSRAIYDLLQKADTVGCFQVESRAQVQMLPKLQPTRFEDIVIGIALIRPGPIQGGMVHPYLRRRQGLEPVNYLHPALEPVLAETMGVIIFQEQVIRVAMAIAGFTPAEADQLRRVLSRGPTLVGGSQEAMEILQRRFLDGALANGVGRATAEEVFRQLAGFAGFGFCKSHAAAFALVAYQTLYLKAYFPAEYTCALLNHQPMGFYPPEVLIGDARRHGVSVLHPDVNHSMESCTLERLAVPASAAHTSGARAAGKACHTPPAIRLGLCYVHGLGEVWQTRIVECRNSTLQDGQEAKSFRNLQDFCRRTHLPRPAVENLIRAGALDSLGLARRDLLWQLGGLVYQHESETTRTTDRVHGVHAINIEVPVEPAVLPTLGQAERMAWEYELLGLAPGDHVMALYREALQKRGFLSSRDLDARQDGEMVRLAGYAVVRQRPPTAKGYLFITLEDEDGLINLIVRPHIYERHRNALRNAPLLSVEGQLQREGHAQSVLVHSAAALGPPASQSPGQ
jgi:error-prone DNA polymerase